MEKLLCIVFLCLILCILFVGIVVGYFAELPKKSKVLFRLREVNRNDPQTGMSTGYIENVVIMPGGFLAITKENYSYSQYAIHYGNSYRYCNPKVTRVSYKMLPELISQSKDRKAKNFVGMNRFNYRKYVKYLN